MKNKIEDKKITDLIPDSENANLGSEILYVLEVWGNGDSVRMIDNEVEVLAVVNNFTSAIAIIDTLIPDWQQKFKEVLVAEDRESVEKYHIEKVGGKIPPISFLIELYFANCPIIVDFIGNDFDVRHVVTKWVYVNRMTDWWMTTKPPRKVKK